MFQRHPAFVEECYLFDDFFINQPEVADGASNLIIKIMGQNSDHARSAVSVNSLPKNATVEIDSVFEITFER